MVLIFFSFHLVPITRCVTNYTQCPATIYNQYLRDVPRQFQVCNQCSLELKFYNRNGKPFSYRKYSTFNYPLIHYGNEMRYILFPRFFNDRGYRILFMITTSTDEQRERMIIRNHFHVFQQKYNIGYLFISAYDEEFNHILTEESRIYHDILQLSHHNSYHNLTLSVLGGLHYISRFHNLSDYVMKTDSDCVVNIPRVLRLLNKLARKYPKYIGKCSKFGKFNIISPQQKNFVPLQLIGNNRKQLSFASGGGYILLTKVIPQLLVAVRHLPFITHLEDVTIGMAASSLRYDCWNRRNWIARNGCGNASSCLKYMIMHKNTSNSDIERFWNYLSN